MRAVYLPQWHKCTFLSVTSGGVAVPVAHVKLCEEERLFQLSWRLFIVL